MKSNPSSGQNIYHNEDGIVRLTERINFARTKRETTYPDLLDVQMMAYMDFLQENVPPSKRENKGLQQAFDGIISLLKTLLQYFNLLL